MYWHWVGFLAAVKRSPGVRNVIRVDIHKVVRSKQVKYHL